MKLALIDDERFDAHVSRSPHPERPERLAAARSGLHSALDDDAILHLPSPEADRAELALVHDEAYLDALDRALAGGWGFVDPDTFHSPGSRDAVLHAAGGAATLARALMLGEARRGLALLRPPGHHAEADRAMGFCMINNVAVATEAALRAGAERVAIIDWDVHHGNGTQHAFEGRDDVLFISLHQWPLYPGTGGAEEVGHGAGAGRTANVALPSGCGDAVYGEAFRRVVVPLVRAHRPDVILVSAGYDAHSADPLAAMEVSADAYGAMTSALVAEAEALGHGRVGFVLEGGYDLAALEASIASTAKAALGAHMDLPESAIGSAASRAIERALDAVSAAWPEPFA